MERYTNRSSTVARAAAATQTAEEQQPADAEVTCTAQQALDDALAKLEQERAAWDAYEPRHYRFQTEVGSEFDPYLSVQTMEVKDGMRIAFSMEQPNLPVRVPVSCFGDTLDALFGCVRAEFAGRECACDCTLEWKITYDPKYHYVVSFYLADRAWTDNGWGFSVTQFTVLE